MATARDLVTDACLWLAVNDAVDPIAPADLDMGIRWLNKIAGHLNNNALISSAITRTVFDLVSGTASYTVGSGGTINVARPVNLTGPGEGLRFIDTNQDPDTEIGLGDGLTDRQYQAIIQKAQTNTYPTAFYYNATIGSSLGTLILWPVPNVSYLDGVLYSRTPIGAFTADTTLVLQPGLDVFLETKLAKWLAPTFGKTISPELKEAAREAEANFLSANTRMQDLEMDPAWTRSAGSHESNFYTGT